MAEFPYISNPARVKPFLEHVQSAGVPPKLTMQYLVQVGFKSTNDRGLIGILKFVGFVGSDGVPTAVWQSYRNKTTGAKVLAGAIHKSYADLFATYPDAHRKDNEALRNYFSAHTKVGEGTIGFIVATFRALCAAADFDNPMATPDEQAAPAPSTAGVPIITPPAGTRAPQGAHPPAPVININIQLELPATDDAKIYDNLFAAMKKHLFP